MPNTNYPTVMKGPHRFTATQAFQRGIAQLGTPYVWGGQSPGGFDCSGFVGWIFWGKRMFTSGNVNKNVAGDYYQMIPLSYSAGVKKGDIVSFTGDPGHVGFYVGDEGTRRGYSGGPVLESSGKVRFGGNSPWTTITRPKEGFGIYIDHFS